VRRSASLAASGSTLNQCAVASRSRALASIFADGGSGSVTRRPPPREDVDRPFERVDAHGVDDQVDDVRADAGCKLDGDVTDAAGGRVDEHSFAALQVTFLEERAPGGQSDHRDGRGHAVGERRRFADDVGGRNRRVFGVGLAGVGQPNETEDLVSPVERGDVCPYRFDDARDVPPGHVRERGVQCVVGVSLPNQPVDGVHTGGTNADQYLVLADVRTRDRLVAQRVGAAVFVDAYRAHRVTPRPPLDSKRFPRTRPGDVRRERQVRRCVIASVRSWVVG